ncbi:hypothetical protein ACLBXO_20715 [Methylobacterium sp. C33D]|uniref:hypothetical protein n=1 Tax=Methylobacterium mesophilicum TaxID=39956 RepID=UPI002F35D0F7
MFHLECSVYRRCASGLSVASERIDAWTNAEAISQAEARFVALLADRSGSATLWDDAGQIVWSTKRFIPATREATASNNL